MPSMTEAHGYKNSATIEHIVPKSKGGTLRKDNCLVVCDSCNRKRSSKHFKSYVAGSRLPRIQWLFSKYELAISNYKQ